MTTITSDFGPLAVPRAALVPALVRQEARRLALHPAFVVGLALTTMALVLTVLHDEQHRDVVGSLSSAPTFFAGVLALFAANLVTIRDLRAGSAEMLAPLPVRLHDRTLALIVASLLPAGLVLALVMTFHALFLLTGFYGRVPGPGLLLQGAVTVWGGCLLGIAVGRWAPVRAASVLLVVVLMAFNVWTEGANPGRRLFGFMTSWLEWSTGSPNKDTPLIAGSPGWHVGYLVSLCLLAAVAALLRTAPRRSGLLVVAAVLCVTATAAGIAQVS
jgi:hypothetical protein